MTSSRNHSQTSRHRRPKRSWRADKPYNQIPLLPPPKVDLETKPILKQCIRARAALAELKGAAKLFPNPSVLINTLALLEAQASSEIENIVTTTDSLFQFRELHAEADPATKEALRYSRALLEGYKAVQKRPLTTRTAEEICTRIKGVQMQVRRVPGTALANERTGEIVYTPPQGEDLIRSLLANWERFLHETTDLDPLIRMAVAHYQFEAIHPFTDGNGRTGRVLNSLFFIRENLLTLPILYLSRYIIQHKADYYGLLMDVTRSGAWKAWVKFMIACVEETARWTTAKVEAIRELATNTKPTLDPQPSLERIRTMAKNGSASPRKQESRTLDANLKRRARKLATDSKVDPRTRSLIRYGLETKDQSLEQIVNRVEAGETSIDHISFDD